MIVFDIDGTILPGTSCERLFVRHLVRARVLGVKHLLYFCSRGIMLLPDGISHCTKANKGYLRGFTPQYMDKLGKQFFDQIVVPRISHKAIDCINEHRDKGQTVILLSGMPQFLLSNFAGFLGIGEYLGSVMETVDGAFDGKTRQPFPLGKGKIAALKLVLDRSGVDWEDLTFYADHWLDRFLLTRVGHPIVVNPHPRLLKLARQKGWQVAIFD